MNAGTIGIVIATYNEAETIGELLDNLPWPVFVVDDSSPDGTGEIARRKRATVLSRPSKSGIASAYRAGFALALKQGFSHIVQMDAGLTHKPADVNRLVERAREGYDLVIGSRFALPVVRTYRSYISRIAAAMMRLLGVNVSDATGGFRCWEAGLLEGVIDRPFKARHFAFQLESLHRAQQVGVRIACIPIEYKLTNSSFRPVMLIEALRIYAGLRRTHVG